MNIQQWLIEVVKGEEIFIAPKNDIATELMSELSEYGAGCSKFVDTYKNDADVVRPDNLSEKDIVLIYSPNYWKEIASAAKQANVYVYHVFSDSENIESIDTFSGYADLDQFNTLLGQRLFWDKHLKEHMARTQDFDDYGFSWGDPENANDELGNYKAISLSLKKLITSDSHVLELGTLGGKWTRYLTEAKKITCVDINSAMVDAITQRYPSELHKIEFYISKGDELSGVDNDSVDVLFCIDTLVRSSELIINSYLSEISRVLCEGGVALLHLPSNKVLGSVERGFTDLNIDEFLTNHQNGFSCVEVDSETLTHGVFLKLQK